ncbi:MAG: 8-amino-7-oxononanoate synthase [Polyangiaceae bacterium]|nr:8-amino-7-oxononanoate synthase [Polyangiaceae bacterium]
MALEFLDDELAALERAGLLRVPAVPSAAGLLDCSTNDYLGYARDVSRETSLGAGASRLIHGTSTEHLDLERALADWVALPAALLFSSGYAANVGLIQALAGPGDVIFSDALNHASLIDGCRLSRARVVVLEHNSLEHLERALEAEQGRRRWVVTESYYSMDGDGPDLRTLRALTEHHRAGWLVDEAHALGVYGPVGAGRCAEAGVKPDALVGTLGKSLGSAGAFVAGSETLRTYLWNRARSLVFSTATSPLLALKTLPMVERVKASDRERSDLLRKAQTLVSRLREAGLPFPRHYLVGPIVPVVLGSTEAAQHLAIDLTAQGFLVQPIRPPTVPEGTSRLRITLRPQLEDLALDHLATLLIAGWKRWSSSAPEQR